MVKYLIAMLILLLTTVTTSARAETKLEIFWKSVKEEVVKYEFSEEVDETAQAIVEDKEEVRKIMGMAREELRKGKMSQFIGLMNRAERQIRRVGKGWNVSMQPELRAYAQLLRLAVDHVTKIANN